MSDFIAINHGSVIALRPMTPEAQAWIDEHLPKDAQYWGRSAAIEPRYFDDIADGIAAEGLTINSEPQRRTP